MLSTDKHAFMNGQNRSNIRPGITVDIVLKEDQGTGKLTRGIVADILTSKRIHPRGIKVRLTSGQVGRVQNIVHGTASARPAAVRDFSPHAVDKRVFRQARPARGGSPRPGFGERTNEPRREPAIPRQKFACPCCGYKTLDGAPGYYEVCPVCYWEDDPLQTREPDSFAGSNHVSLNAARTNFAAFGACEERYKAAVRKPEAGE